jgi:S1-C subfamily serine protease
VAAWFDNWPEVAPEAQPQPQDYAFNLDRACASVVGLSSRIPPDAYTAGALGIERTGNGVVIADDLVLTIGYLVMEADQIDLATVDDKIAPGHVLGVDHATGFGLIQALEPLGVPALPLGRSRSAKVGDKVVVAGAGGRTRSVAAKIAAKEEFAGYWEYVLDEAIFTRPAHPHWSGAALIGAKGDLLGIGSLHVQQQGPGGRFIPLNMHVPIDLLHKVYDSLLAGKPNQPPRPWLGVLAHEVDGAVMVVGFAGEGPAKRAGLNEGDVVVAVGGAPVQSLAEFYRGVWALGEAGVEVPLTLDREGDLFEVRINSADRGRYLKSRRLH